MNKTRDLHKWIRENENVDSDFWVFGGNDSVTLRLQSFGADEFNNLLDALPTWTSYQLCILADALISTQFDLGFDDTNAVYGYIFTLVEDSEADYLIQNIGVIDDGEDKSVELLLKIKERIILLERYTRNIHQVHDYGEYVRLLDKLINKASW